MKGTGLIGLLGILLAVMSTELNDLVTNLALPDIQGGLGISRDEASWLRSLYTTSQIIGMSAAPSLGIAFSVRRFALFGITLSCTTNLLFICGGPSAILFILRFLQGLSQGFVIPLLITVALKVSSPRTRLYALALYALTATLIPNLAATIAALWVDVIGDWRFLFLESLPLCTIAGLLVWWGMPQEEPQSERLAKLDWPGLCLLAAGFGSLSTVLLQGDRLDWFNSTGICLGTLISAIAIPLFLWNETRAPLPLFRFDLFKKRNFAYAIICLFLFLIVNLSASQVPITFLQQVAGYRPQQYYLVTLQIAAAQLILLPAVAFLLDRRWADSRVVSALGLVCILTACGLAGFLSSAWNRDEFFLIQTLQSVGQPLVVMSLLLMATNTLKPEEGPYASATVNTARALSEAVGGWLLALIMRLRGGLHLNRILDEAGQHRIAASQVVHAPGASLSGSGTAGGAGRSLSAFYALAQREADALTAIDAFIILGALVVVLLVILAILPVRTFPPRLNQAQGS